MLQIELVSSLVDDEIDFRVRKSLPESMAQSHRENRVSDPSETNDEYMLDFQNNQYFVVQVENKRIILRIE